MRQLLPLLTSVCTLWAMYETGNKRSRGWTIGLFNQVLWLAFIVMFDAWGLLPLSIALVVMHSRNLILWRADERAVAGERP